MKIVKSSVLVNEKFPIKLKLEHAGSKTLLMAYSTCLKPESAKNVTRKPVHNIFDL